MSSAFVHGPARGGVRGVAYRKGVDHRALASGLEGWVRNRRDGSVEAVFAGPADIVANMIVRCRRGPPSARVEALTEEPAGAGELNLRRPGQGFSVLPTV